MLYRIILGLLALFLLIALFSCASGQNDGKGTDTVGTAAGTPAGAPAHPMRLLLAGSEARDSAAIATEAFVDQALRQALDSIPSAQYITINYRDSLADAAIARGEKGVAVEELADRLNLDGVIYTRIARFSSVLAVELRVLDPKSKQTIYRNLSFGVVRYRDSSGTMYLGPTLYDVIRRSIGKFFGQPHTPATVIATEPLVVSSLAIDRDTRLGRIGTNRQEFSTEAVKALGEFARMRFPELVAFDYDSRGALYRIVNVASVEDYMPMAPTERRALFNVGIEHYLTGSATVTESDSLRLRLELRYVVSGDRDTLVDFSEKSFRRTQFETTTAREDFVVALIDLAEPLYNRETARIREVYNAYVARRAGSGAR